MGEGFAVSVTTKRSKRARNQPLQLAGHTVMPGERMQFDLPAANLYTHTPLGMPVEVMHGQYAGPVLLVCAAIHGDELNGVEIIRRLRSIKAMSRLHGTLVLVPVVNLFGFIMRSYNEGHFARGGDSIFFGARSRIRFSRKVLSQPH